MGDTHEESGIMLRLGPEQYAHFSMRFSGPVLSLHLLAAEEFEPYWQICWARAREPDAEGRIDHALAGLAEDPDLDRSDLTRRLGDVTTDLTKHGRTQEAEAWNARIERLLSPAKSA